MYTESYNYETMDEEDPRKEVKFHYNSDMSGEVIISNTSDGTKTTLPFTILVKFVMEHLTRWWKFEKFWKEKD